MFFDVTDGIFTNYTWKEKFPSQSAAAAGGRAMDVYTGIDIWGRNTYGGGGFNCHKALREINNMTSIALFAPGWYIVYNIEGLLSSSISRILKIMTEDCGAIQWGRLMNWVHSLTPRIRVALLISLR